MLVCQCLHAPSFGEQLRTRGHRSVLYFELGIEGCWFSDMIILMASTLNVLKDVRRCHMEGFKMIYWWFKGQDVTLSKIGSFYFDWSIHICNLNYREIWARYSDLESNTYHICLISVATYDFIFTSFFNRMCKVFILYHRPNRISFWYVLGTEWLTMLLLLSDRFSDSSFHTMILRIGGPSQLQILVCQWQLLQICQCFIITWTEFRTLQQILTLPPCA